MIESVEVLNGTIKRHDMIAWAVREGNSAAMRVGQVVDFVETGRTRGKYTPGEGYSEVPIIRVRARIDLSSGWSGERDRLVGVEMHDRIVKLYDRPTT